MNFSHIPTTAEGHTIVPTDEGEWNVALAQEVWINKDALDEELASAGQRRWKWWDITNHLERLLKITRHKLQGAYAAAVVKAASVADEDGKKRPQWMVEKIADLDPVVREMEKLVTEAEFQYLQAKQVARALEARQLDIRELCYLNNKERALNNASVYGNSVREGDEDRDYEVQHHRPPQPRATGPKTDLTDLSWMNNRRGRGGQNNAS